MSKIPLTEDELVVIRNNPNVEKASNISIKFTADFKKKAYEELNAGKPILQIFEEAGFDTCVLGMYRIRGFKDKLLYKKGDVSDRRKNNYHRPPTTGKETIDDRVKQLEHELAYTRQEVEFFKKIQIANMEAQKEWESKHQQK